MQFLCHGGGAVVVFRSNELVLSGAAFGRHAPRDLDPNLAARTCRALVRASQRPLVVADAHASSAAWLGG